VLLTPALAEYLLDAGLFQNGVGWKVQMDDPIDLSVGEVVTTFVGRLATLSVNESAMK
jgi:hypothetical protein